MPKHVTLLSLPMIGCTEEIPETGNTLEQNALLKSDHVAKKYGYDCFADDTGLLVDALNGLPGVYSARYAGEERDPEKNMAKLLKALDGIENRAARFETVISLHLKGRSQFFKGTVNGTITHTKNGGQGFGYDPIFQPEGHSQTFAQLPLATKNQIGHRGRAIKKLIEFLNSYQ